MLRHTLGAVLAWFITMSLSSQVLADQTEDPIESLRRIPTQRPNVVLIVADDLNCAIGPYGDPVAVTPHLDRLAKRATTFERAYCQQAVCNPSRSSFLTGLRPDRVGVDDLRKYFRETAPHGKQLVTLPEHFKNHGYFCQNIGKIFHNMGDTQDRRSWSIDETFYFGTHADDTVYRNRLISGAKPAIKAPLTESLSVPDTVYRDGQIANFAATVLREQAETGPPFFLAVGFWRPHLPFVAPRKYWDLYDEDSIPTPSPLEKPMHVPEIAMHDSREIEGYGEKQLSEDFDDEKIRHLRHGYYASISFLDAQVGKILDALWQSPHASNTIVVFTSDHGFHIGEQSLWGKTSNFELDARVPLIIAAPHLSKQQATSTSAICELVDLYPTLADLAGILETTSDSLQGTSLVPVLENPKTQVKSFAITQHQHPFYGNSKNWKAMGYSLRDQRWRLTQWRDIQTDQIIATELYDHLQDPEETINVAGRPANQSTVRKLSSQLNQAVTSGRTSVK